MPDGETPDPFADLAARFAAAAAPTEAGAQWRQMAAHMYQLTAALVEQGYSRREAVELTARIFGFLMGRQQ